MGCCGDDEPPEQQGINKERKCRDVLCLLIFVAFWAGMFVILGFAASQGDTNRLVYGSDSQGFTCGRSSSFENTTIDLSGAKNMYYLNPLELLSFSNIPYAKTICVDGCPGISSVCNATALPCLAGTQYRCEYYRFAPSPIYGKLPGVSDASTTWFDQLATLGTVQDANAPAVVTELQNLNVPWINNYLTANSITASTSQNGKYYQLTSAMPGQGPCYPIFVQTTKLFNRCFPRIPDEWSSTVVQQTGATLTSVSDSQLNSYKDKFNSASQKWSRYVGDISKAILLIIVAGLIAGVVLSLFWMVIMRYAAGIMAWLTILLVNVALIGITIYCFSLAGLLGNNKFGNAVSSTLPASLDPTEDERTTWKYIGIGAAVVAGVVLLLTLLMISRVRIAVACIKVASQAVGSMPSILLFPILPFIFEVGLLVYWISITALLYSAGTVTANCRASGSTDPFMFQSLAGFTVISQPLNATNVASCYSGLSKDDRAAGCGEDPDCHLSYDWNNKLKYAFIYHFFGLLWTNQFLVGISCVTVAGAIASFYWARGDRSQMPTFPVLTGLKNTLLYHLGSIAFGSFIIACVQLIRFLLDYLDRKTKELQAANACVSFLMCCVQCCMWCLEKIVAFINRNAYIMIGVKGTSYCVSAGRAISLIITNVLRIAAVNFVGDILLFLGKVMVAACCGLIAFAMATLPLYTDPVGHPDTYLSSPVLPVAISIITGFIIAEIFFSVYEMAIDTIMLSFCEDCEVNGGNPKYAPQLLMDVMGETAVAVPAGGAHSAAPIAK